MVTLGTNRCSGNQGCQICKKMEKSGNSSYLVLPLNASIVWLPESEKNFEDMFIRFDMIHERDRQTYRRTDGHRMTAYIALMHSIVR